MRDNHRLLHVALGSDFFFPFPFTFCYFCVEHIIYLREEAARRIGTTLWARNLNTHIADGVDRRPPNSEEQNDSMAYEEQR